VLVEYLIPLQNTATAQGEHVFFDIDVKGGENEWSRSDAIVGGPNRLAQPFRVAINAKGGYCWHVYRQSMLVIDGKNNNDDGMVTGKNNNDVDRFTVGSELVIGKEQSFTFDHGNNNDGK
jgi:hypothetical protein